MSYRIEYQFAALRIPGVLLADGIDRFAVCIEGGDNNLYEGSGPHARRSRSWCCSMIGTSDEVMEDACEFASACEGGSLKPLGRDCTPEAYISRIENTLKKASDIRERSWGVPYISLVYQTEPGSAEDTLLSAIGVTRTVVNGRWDDKPKAEFAFRKDNENDYATFFSVHSKLKKGPQGWAFAKAGCSGSK